MQRMIENANKTGFQLPVLLIPVIAFGINLMGDYIGGTMALNLCDRLRLGRDATNGVLLLSVALNALIVMLWVKCVERRSLKELGFYADRCGKHILIGASVGTGAVACMVAAGFLLNVISFRSVDTMPDNILKVLLILPCWAVQAGAEEILTRGWVLPVVSAKTNKWIGIVVSSTLFMLMHISNAGFNIMAGVNVFLIGVLLGLYTLKSDSLWGAIAFHTFWNFMIGSFFGLSVSGGTAMQPYLFNFISSGNTVLSGGGFGLEASVINTVITGILLCVLLTMNRKKHPHRQ